MISISHDGDSGQEPDILNTEKRHGSPSAICVRVPASSAEQVRDEPVVSGKSERRAIAREGNITAPPERVFDEVASTRNSYPCCTHWSSLDPGVRG